MKSLNSNASDYSEDFDLRKKLGLMFLIIAHQRIKKIIVQTREKARATV